jgi:hypothetical protein
VSTTKTSADDARALLASFDDHQKPWWSQVSKPMLVGLLTVLALALLYHEKGWRDEVNAGLRSAASRDDLKRALDEVQEIRVEQLKFFAWQAERMGDRGKAAEINQQLVREGEKGKATP